MDFDALVMNPQGFNTLDKLASSAAPQQMAQQTLQNIQTMQTSMPQGHVPEHVVLPIFQKQEDRNANNKEEANIFVALNGAQKGPFTIEQLKGLAIADVINADSQVWMPGLSEWTDLKTCLANLKN